MTVLGAKSFSLFFGGVRTLTCNGDLLIFWGEQERKSKGWKEQQVDGISGKFGGEGGTGGTLILTNFLGLSDFQRIAFSRSPGNGTLETSASALFCFLANHTC